ncbi:MAG: hypothetical protein RLZ81_1731 [Pseudomonadota bacterium]|jgi:hypothetical protein
MGFFKALAAAALAGLLTTNALAVVDVHGVKFEDTADVHGAKLQLNGAGTRYKAIFKVYAAGLYLGKKAGSLEEVVNTPGPKRMTITMLRGIDAKELGKLLTRGIEDNMGKSEMSKLIPGLVRMGEMFATQKPMVTGDNFMIEWIPGQGSIITVRGQVQGEPFKEPEFFRALMSIWLGPAPADYKLKENLLGVVKSN